MNSKAIGLAVTAALLPTLAAKAARSAADRGLSKLGDGEQHPAHPDTSFKDAARWAIVTGAIGAFARLATQRWMARQPGINKAEQPEL